MAEAEPWGAVKKVDHPRNRKQRNSLAIKCSRIRRQGLREEERCYRVLRMNSKQMPLQWHANAFFFELVCAKAASKKVITIKELEKKLNDVKIKKRRYE
ncbi:hypothetical protein PIB30_074646 [Stylosanthes scabra]|uniref:Uncharacterized protein n=1 Tax=Stylosanthes scabra TaxID=79078 RepID=A0ABU6ZNI2_9FABA|nr:hypothetical protein [Stylosanthes scabra]